jgi:hypothetical protein
MGTKALTARDEIQKEVEKQLSMGFSDLPSTSQCLLEISPEQLFEMGTSEKQYWLNAAEAARTAANNALHISKAQSNSWVEIMKTPTYKARAEQCQQSMSTLPPDDTSKVKSNAPNKPSKAPNKLLRHPNDEERSHRATRQPSPAQQAASQIVLNYLDETILSKTLRSPLDPCLHNLPTRRLLPTSTSAFDTVQNPLSSPHSRH